MSGLITISPPAEPFAFVLKVGSGRQLEELNAERRIPFEMKASSREAPMFTIAGTRGPSLTVWSTSSASGFATRALYDDDLFAIRFIDRGSMVRREGSSEVMADRSRAMLVVTSDTIRGSEVSSDFASVGATVSRAAITAGHAALVGQDDGFTPDFEPLATAGSRPMLVLRNTIETILSHMRQIEPNDFILHFLEEVLVYQILSSWPQRSALKSFGVAAVPNSSVQRMIEYINANLAERISLQDLASVAGVSVRSIQLAFRKELGTTPMAYIIDRRLRAVRAALQSPEFESVSISQIARRWGFTHQGDFGQRFRRCFGATPASFRRSG